MRGDLLLYIGAGVILHDHRTLALLTNIALGNGVAAAACPLVTHSTRGKDSSISVEDAGMVRSADSLIALAGNVSRFWNTALPVAQLPNDLWLARKGCLNADTEIDDTLILTTQLTASYFAPRDTESFSSPLSLLTGQNALHIRSWLA